MNDEPLRKNQYRYSFGPDKNNLDGIIYIDTENINNSMIEKMSTDISYYGGMQVIVNLIHHIRDTQKAPDIFEYANG